MYIYMCMYICMYVYVYMYMYLTIYKYRNTICTYNIPYICICIRIEIEKVTALML